VTDPFYVTAEPATARVSTDLLTDAVPVTGAAALELLWSAFDMETGVVEDGALTDTPAIGALARSAGWVGTYSYDVQLSAAVQLSTGAAAPWMSVVSWSGSESWSS